MDIPWDQPAHLMRITGAGEEVVRNGVVEQLVAAFVELPPDQQQGLMLRSAGADDTCEWAADEIRELAARPEMTGAFGRWDSRRDPDPDDETEAADDATLVEAGVSGPTGSGSGLVDTDRPEASGEPRR